MRSDGDEHAEHVLRRRAGVEALVLEVLELEAEQPLEHGGLVCGGAAQGVDRLLPDLGHGRVDEAS
jgi:hypothetical protein